MEKIIPKIIGFAAILLLNISCGRRPGREAPETGRAPVAADLESRSKLGVLENSCELLSTKLVKVDKSHVKNIFMLKDSKGRSIRVECMMVENAGQWEASSAKIVFGGKTYVLPDEIIRAIWAPNETIFIDPLPLSRIVGEEWRLALLAGDGGESYTKYISLDSKLEIIFE